MSKIQSGIALIVCGSVLLATKGIFAKVLYSEGVRFETLLMIRTGLSIPLYWLWATRRGGWSAIGRTESRILLISAGAGMLCFYVGAMLDFYALTLIDAGLERVILYTYPAFIVMTLSAKNRRRPERRVAGALLLTFAGVMLAVGGVDASLLRANTVGAFLVLIGAVTYTVYFFANEYVGKRVGSSLFTALAMTSGSIMLTIHFLLLVPTSSVIMSSKAWVLLILMVIFATVIPVLMLAEGVNRVGAQRASLISTVGPPSTIVMAWMILDEQMRWIQWTGVLAILSGIYVLERRRQLAPLAD